MWELANRLVEIYGLPALVFLAVCWQWYRERKENTELNAEVRANSCETTAALVSVKDVTESFKESLLAIDARLSDCNKHVDDMAAAAHREMSARLEAIEKKLLELTVRLD